MIARDVVDWQLPWLCAECGERVHQPISELADPVVGPPLCPECCEPMEIHEFAEVRDANGHKLDH